MKESGNKSFRAEIMLFFLFLSSTLGQNYDQTSENPKLKANRTEFRTYTYEYSISLFALVLR